MFSRSGTSAQRWKGCRFIGPVSAGSFEKTERAGGNAGRTTHGEKQERRHIDGIWRGFLKYAGASVNALREGAESISQARTRGKTRLAIGILPTVAASILPMAVERFRKLGMDVTLQLHSAPNNFLLGQLRVGDLDLVVGRLAEPTHMSGLSFEHLYSESIVFAVRKGHPLMSKERLNFRDIRDYTVLFPPQGTIIAKAAEAVLLAEGWESCLM